MFLKLLKSKAFKPSSVIMAFALLFSSITCNAGEVVMKSGTPISLELLNTLSSSSARAGQNIDFRVLNDIVISKKIVIPQGSIAKGQVVRVKKNGLLGFEGQLEVTIRSVKAVDGSEIFLSSSNLSDEGSNKLALSIVLTFLCLFGFLIKGGNAVLTSGTQIYASTTNNATIEVE